MPTDDTVIRATVWNDDVEEREYHRIGDLYPEGLHGAAHEKLHRTSDPARPAAACS